MRCSLFGNVLLIPYPDREAEGQQGKLQVPPSPPTSPSSRASSDPHYSPIIFHTGNIFLPNAFSDFLYVKMMSEQPDDDQTLLQLIHYGGKLSTKTKIQSPHLQLFPPLLLLDPAISKSAKEGKLKLQTFCIFNHNHLGKSNLTGNGWCKKHLLASQAEWKSKSWWWGDIIAQLRLLSKEVLSNLRNKHTYPQAPQKYDFSWSLCKHGSMSGSNVNVGFSPLQCFAMFCTPSFKAHSQWDFQLHALEERGCSKNCGRALWSKLLQ